MAYSPISPGQWLTCPTSVLRQVRSDHAALVAQSSRRISASDMAYAEPRLTGSAAALPHLSRRREGRLCAVPFWLHDSKEEVNSNTYETAAEATRAAHEVPGRAQAHAELVALGRDPARNPARLCGDLADLTGLAETVRQVAPDVIVNAAAYTAVVPITTG